MDINRIKIGIENRGVVRSQKPVQNIQAGKIPEESAIPVAEDNVDIKGKPLQEKPVVNPTKPETAAPQEFLDLMKHIPPWKHVKVFLVHGSHTGGHRSAAESVKQALDELPNVHAEVINALDFGGGKTGKKAQVAATDFVMNKMSGVRGWFFKKSFEGNPIIHWLGKTGMKMKSWVSKSFLNKIQEEKPDIILSCHSPMNAMLGYWKEQGKIDAPVHSVVTDYRIHRMWAQDGIDQYYVASEGAKKDLERFGIDDKKISITGIPIKPDFAKPSGLSKAEMKEKLGIDPKIPMVLMMGGSLGLGRFGDVAEALNQLKTPVQMVCITGKNETKKAELEDMKKDLQMPMTVLGYTKNVNEWMEACDMIVSKPGGLTTSEIFAKNIPMIILDPMAGLEEMLVESITSTGAAFTVKGPTEAAELVEQVINDPSTKDEITKSLGKVGKPFAAYELGKDLIETVLQEPSP